MAAEHSMKISVLGGGGFLGGWIVEALLRTPHRVCVLARTEMSTRLPDNFTSRLDWQIGNAQASRDLTRCIRGADWVIHLADSGLPDRPGRQPDINQLTLTRRLLEQMQQSGAARLLFVSSGGAVYGPPERVPIDESHPRRPISAYGITKKAVEDLLLADAPPRGIRPCILRVANAYGPGQRLDGRQGAATTFLARANAGQPLTLYGRGEIVRDFIYAADVAEACLHALAYRGREQVFNIGTGIGTRLAELVDQVEALCGPVERRWRSDRVCDVPINILSADLARRELGWQARTALSAGLNNTLAWIRCRDRMIY